ncbi:MAG: 5-methyltetrahydropteroyltriglutamate--homocysteine methyltransferase [Halobacteriaceae archaeon]
MNVTAHSLGLFPRDSEAVTTIPDAVAIQRRAGLDAVVDGQLQWTGGLAHPLAAATGVTPGEPVHSIPGAETAPRPVIHGPLDAATVLATEVRALSTQTDRPVMVVPGPYTLATIADDRHYGDTADRLEAVAALLAAEIAATPPVETVLVHEPHLATTPPSGEVAGRVPTALDTALAPTDARSIVVPYGAVLTDRVHAHVLDADIDVLGYDLLADHTRVTDLIAEYGTTDAVALCVLDPRQPVPSADTLTQRVRWVRDRVPEVVPIEEAVLCPTRGLNGVDADRLASVLSRLGRVADTAAR